MANTKNLKKAVKKQVNKEENDKKRKINEETAEVVEEKQTKKVKSKEPKPEVLKNVLIVSNLSLSVEEIILRGCMNEIAEEQNTKVKKITILIRELKEETESKKTDNKKHYPKKIQITGPKVGVVEFEKPLNTSFNDYKGAPVCECPIDLRYATIEDKRILITVRGSPITAEEAKEYLSEVGPIEHFEEVLQNKFICQFKDFESVREALTYNGADIHGAPAEISAKVLTK
ncbi:hypothetical protein ABK040_003689 [Willaertia magna]